MSQEELGETTKSQLEKMKTDQPPKRGKLKLFIGYAAGVGKTYTMLSEAHRRKQREMDDIVIGFIEPHGRQPIVELMEGLEIIPPRKTEYQGSEFEEMDMDAILARKPKWCLVDELAHTNAPCSKNPKRWEDVYELLAAGISVLSTVNIQHLESLNDTVFDLTGVRVKETLPDRVLREADDVVDVDLTPEALRNRIDRGEVFISEKAEQALENFFRDENLLAFREMTLRELAGRVDQDFEAMKAHHARVFSKFRERIVVCIEPGPRAARIIRRGYRIAQAINHEVVALYVKTPVEDLKYASDETLAFLEEMHIPLVVLEGDPAAEIAEYVLANDISHIVMGHLPPKGILGVFKHSVLHTLLARIPEVDITVVGEPSKSS